MKTLLHISAFILFSVICLPASANELKKAYNEGSAHLDKKNYAEAAKSFERAIELNPNIPQMYNILGITYLQMPDEFDRAVTAFEQAIEADPKFIDGYINLGIAFSRTGQSLDRALDEFTRAHNLDPENVRVNFSLGWLYLNYKQDAENAIKHLSAVIEKDREHIEANYSLGMAYLAGGERARVLKHISMLRLLNRDDLAKQLEERAYETEADRIPEDVDAV